MRFFLFLFLLTNSMLVAQQNLDRQIQSNRSRLSEIRNEMDRLQSKIRATDIRKTSTLEQMKHLDEQVSLLTKSRRILNESIQLLTRKINITSRQIKENREALKILRLRYAERSVVNYKFGKINNLRLLLESESFNQALVRYKYMKYFADQEARTVRKIKGKIKKITALERALNGSLKEQRQTLKQKDEEQNRIAALKDEKQALVKKLTWNKQAYKKQLNEIRKQYEKLVKIIAGLEEQRRQREQRELVRPDLALKFDNFKAARGKLPWPVRGKVINTYGKKKNRILKTYTINPGIDIRAESGTHVRAVFSGLVSMITYLSGYGNTVILDHGNGYYSVYSHLDEVLVKRDDFLKIGQTVGLVGDSGSLEGSKLHLEIYAGQKTVNPLVWLRKP